MPSLLELQRAVHRSLLDEADDSALAHIVAAGLAPAQRLNIHRNTILGTLIRALRLSYPAVQRLVGAEFFDVAAEHFTRTRAPNCAELNVYGGEFADFLQCFAPAASIAYLPDVARLEWLVNRALHAADVPPLDLSKLATLAPCDHGRIRFTAHPSLSLLRSPYPVDVIWRAVLQRDDAALAAIDLSDGPAHVMVVRPHVDVEVLRLEEPAWCFAKGLVGGRSLDEALLAAASKTNAPQWLARHLAEEHFIAYQVHVGGDACLKS